MKTFEAVWIIRAAFFVFHLYRGLYGMNYAINFDGYKPTLMTTKFNTLLFIALTIFFTTKELNAQSYIWSKPVTVTKMNGGKISVCYSFSHPDSISYKIDTRCSGLENVYTCFAFKYLDRNLMERTHIVRGISLAKNYKKEYHVYTKYGFLKLVQPFLPETVVAYINDSKTNEEAASQKSRPE